MNKSARFSKPHVARRDFRKQERRGPYERPNSNKVTFPGGNRDPPFNRVFVSNIPYTIEWQGLKDLFREEVGEVTYVQLMKDDSGKSRGFGVVEFKTRDLAEDAVEKMNRYEIGERKLVVKVDSEGWILKKALGRVQGGTAQAAPREMHAKPPPLMGSVAYPVISPRAPAFQQNDRVPNDSDDGRAVGNSIFVANLDYQVNYAKLKEVFKLAGNVVKIELHLDQNSKSRGMATVTYGNPTEALRAVTMFNKQLLYERPMVVRMDRENQNDSRQQMPGGSRSGVAASGRPGMHPYMRAARSNEDFPVTGGSAGGVGSIPGLSKLSTHLSQMSRERSSYGVGAVPGLSARIHPEERDFRGESLRSRDREQIDLDIARVDSRIRDLDESLAAGGRRFDGRSANSTVFVCNLPFHLTWDQVRDEFSQVGDVEAVELKMVNGNSKGYGWVKFVRPRDAEVAIDRLHGVFLEGRKIEVKFGDHAI